MVGVLVVNWLLAVLPVVARASERASGASLRSNESSDVTTSYLTRTPCIELSSVGSSNGLSYRPFPNRQDKWLAMSGGAVPDERHRRRFQGPTSRSRAGHSPQPRLIPSVILTATSPPRANPHLRLMLLLLPRRSLSLHSSPSSTQSTRRGLTAFRLHCEQMPPLSPSSPSPDPLAVMTCSPHSSKTPWSISTATLCSDWQT